MNSLDAIWSFGNTSLRIVSPLQDYRVNLADVRLDHGDVMVTHEALQEVCGLP